MTYRERRERKAERLREWAEKREAKAAAVFKTHEVYRGDHAFNTQPGHIPERARVIAREDRAIESLQKAHSMDDRAAEIERQLNRAIYSDDPDARECLEERISALESERNRITTINSAARKFKTPEAYTKALAVRQLGELEITQDEALALARCAFWGERFKPGYDPYVLRNLAGNIKRQRDRLATLNQPAQPRYYAAKYAGTCTTCGNATEKGTPIVYYKADQSVKHYECYMREIEGETKP